jgi:hypothetical protein
VAPAAKKRKFHPLPAPGDIVWCAFPQAVGVPGPKKRPALVARVAPATHEISVVYGTSRKTNQIYATEIVLDPADPGFSISGLSHRSKFDVAHQVQLPFDSDWFEPAPGPQSNTPLPKMGVLHPSYMPAIAAAVKKIRP